MEMKRAGTLKVSKKTSAAFSLFLLGLRGASVSSTGCCRRRKKTESLERPTATFFHIRSATYLLGEGLQLLFGVNVLPDPLHVVPVLHDAVFHWVAHRQQAPVLLAAKRAVKLGEDSLERQRFVEFKTKKKKTKSSLLSVFISGKKKHSE